MHLHFFRIRKRIHKNNSNLYRIRPTQTSLLFYHNTWLVGNTILYSVTTMCCWVWNWLILEYGKLYEKKIFIFVYTKTQGKKMAKGEITHEKKKNLRYDWLLLNFQPEVLQLYSGREQVQPYIYKWGRDGSTTFDYHWKSIESWVP